MSEQNYTIRFNEYIPLSDDLVMDLSYCLLKGHDVGNRKGSLKRDNMAYSFTHIDSRLDVLAGGTVHRYEGSIYCWDDEFTQILEGGFSLIQKIDQTLN